MPRCGKCGKPDVLLGDRLEDLLEVYIGQMLLLCAASLGIRVCLFLASKTMKFDKQFPWSSHGQCNQLGQQSLGFVSPLNPMRASKKAATAQQRFRVRYEFLMAAPWNFKAVQDRVGQKVGFSWLPGGLRGRQWEKTERTRWWAKINTSNISQLCIYIYIYLYMYIYMFNIMCIYNIIYNQLYNIYISIFALRVMTYVYNTYTWMNIHSRMPRHAIESTQ